MCKHAPGNIREDRSAAPPRPGKLLITVTDEGVDFAQAPGTPSVFPSFGLTTMRERAQSIGAALSVESLPSAGTEVRVEQPLPVN